MASLIKKGRRPSCVLREGEVFRYGVVGEGLCRKCISTGAEAAGFPWGSGPVLDERDSP